MHFPTTPASARSGCLQVNFTCPGGLNGPCGSLEQAVVLDDIDLCPQGGLQSMSFPSCARPYTTLTNTSTLGCPDCGFEATIETTIDIKLAPDRNCLKTSVSFTQIMLCYATCEACKMLHSILSYFWILDLTVLFMYAAYMQSLPLSSCALLQAVDIRQQAIDFLGLQLSNPGPCRNVQQNQGYPRYSLLTDVSQALSHFFLLQIYYALIVRALTFKILKYP